MYAQAQRALWEINRADTARLPQLYVFIQAEELAAGRILNEEVSTSLKLYESNFHAEFFGLLAALVLALPAVLAELCLESGKVEGDSCNLAFPRVFSSVCRLCVFRLG